MSPARTSLRNSRLNCTGRQSSRDGRLALKQLATPDPRGHVLRLLAIDGPVVEFDDRILTLAAQLLERFSLAAAERSLDYLVLDALFVERLLDLPARMGPDLDPHIRAAVE